MVPEYSTVGSLKQNRFLSHGRRQEWKINSFYLLNAKFVLRVSLIETVWLRI